MHYLHPFLLAIYPVVFLYSHYVERIPVEDLFKASAVAVLLVVLIVLGLHRLKLPGRVKPKPDSTEQACAGLHSLAVSFAAFILVGIVICYGHVYNGLYTRLSVAGLTIGGHGINGEWLGTGLHALLFPLSSLVMGAALYLSRKLSQDSLSIINHGLLVFSIVLIAAPLWYIGSVALTMGVQASGFEANSVADVRPNGSGDACEYCDSDIYYIVLDGYARSDALKKYYDYDNGVFARGLENMGFTIVDSARSNYVWTMLSLSSSLNMRYVNDLAESEGRYSKSQKRPIRMMRDNDVMLGLKKLGYSYVHMNSTWGPTLRNPNADISFDCSKGFVQNDFYRTLIEGTLFRLFSPQESKDLAECHVRNFAWLGKKAPHISGRKFVFAHFILPHYPYLFDEQGQVLKHAMLSDKFEIQKLLWADRESYRRQLMYLNKEVLQTVAEIKANSKNPPFIIIQSDHGPQILDRKGEKAAGYIDGRTAILMAIHTPDNAVDIGVRTPVNLFRHLFTRYLGQEIPLLEDRIFHSAYHSPYDFNEVTDPDSMTKSGS